MVLEKSFGISQLFLNVIYASGLKCYGSSQRRKFSNKLFCHRVPFPALMKCAALSDLFLGHAGTMKEGLSFGYFSKYNNNESQCISILQKQLKLREGNARGLI